MSNKTKLSKWLSYILRHEPESIDLSIDKNGWASVSELIEKADKDIDLLLLREIVAEDTKQRYSFNDDETMIRANQGHSIDVELDLEEIEPPELLYHGTATRFLNGILGNGIVPRTRTHVHLSFDMKTAQEVGERHGEPVILIIEAHKMWEEGHKFFISANGVPLAKKIPKDFIEIGTL